MAGLSGVPVEHTRGEIVHDRLVSFHVPAESDLFDVSRTFVV